MKNNGPITFKYDELFTQDGIKWRITALCNTFVIATRCGVNRNNMNHNDLLKVIKPI